MRYIVGFLLAIGLLILAIVLVVQSLHGGKSTSISHPLTDYAYTNTQVEMTIDGPINADQAHNELQMVVGSSLSQINLQQGYQGTVTQSKTYANNPSSYAEFLKALDLAGFTQGVTGPGVNNNPIGYCAFGERYTYQIINPEGSTIQNFWSTSCGGEGTFKGNATTVLNLFSAQMPDYDSLVNGTNLQS